MIELGLIEVDKSLYNAVFNKNDEFEIVVKGTNYKKNDKVVFLYQNDKRFVPGVCGEGIVLYAENNLNWLKEGYILLGIKVLKEPEPEIKKAIDFVNLEKINNKHNLVRYHEKIRG